MDDQELAELRSQVQQALDDLSKLNDTFENHDHLGGFGSGLQITIDAISGFDEETQDTVGDMVTGNTETFITVTYQDDDGTLDFVVPVKDEDDMASDSATHLATQQSIKKYVDDNLVSSSVTMIVGEDVAIRESLYQDNYGFNMLTDSNYTDKTANFKGIAKEAATGATESGVGAGSDHEHYTIAVATDYVTANTTPATIIAAAANTNTANLDASDDTDYQTATTTAGQYCYQLIHWDAGATATRTIQRIKVLVEASAGGASQTSGWSCYVWNFTNSKWDEVGTTAIAYSSDTTLQKAFNPTDYVDGSNNVYVLIKTTAVEAGGVNALKLEVDFASLQVGVNCEVIISGEITGYATSSFVEGSIVYLSNTAGEQTTNPGNATVKKPIGIATSDTSISLMFNSPGNVFEPTFIIPEKAVTNTNLWGDVFGQSNTNGRIAHLYSKTATAVESADETFSNGDSTMFGTKLNASATSFAPGAGFSIYDNCVFGSNVIMTTQNIGGSNENIHLLTYPDISAIAWSATAINAGARFVCTDGDNVYVYYNNGLLYKRKFLDGTASAGTNSIDLTFTANNTTRGGAFYLNGYVYIIVFTADGGSPYTRRVEVAKVPVDFSSTSVTTLWTQDGFGDDAFSALGEAIHIQDYVMPYDDGIVYVVIKMDNFFHMRSVVNLKAL